MKHLSLVACFVFQFIHSGNTQPANDSILQRQSYIFDEFIIGTVLSKSGEINQAPLNYCAYDQSILFKREEQVMTLTGLEAIDTIYIANRKFIPVGNKVYELINGKGMIQLCVSYTSKLVPWIATSDHNGSSLQKNNEVSNTVSNVYVSRPYKGDFSIQVMKKFCLKSYKEIYKANNLKDFLKVFKESTNPSVSEYVKQNKIDFSNEADLVKLVDFCNSK